jgi:hypothetical protein
MSKPNQNNPTAYALRMTMSDGLELYYNSKRCVATIKTGKNKIGLFATSQDAELVRTVRNIKASELYDVVLITFVGSRVDIGTPQQSEPKQPETAKDSPTRDGETQGKIDWDNAKMRCSFFSKSTCEGYCGGENVLPKPEQEKPAQAEPITPEKEQEFLAKINKELAKFASLEVFNADRKNFFLPPVGKLEFDKMKAAIECTVAIAKMVRPDYFDKINQIKVPTSEQPKAEQNQPEIHPPNPQKVALNKIVLGRIEEIEKLLGNPNLSAVELSLPIHDYASALQLDLADFRRKHLDLGAVEQGEVEPKETVQCEEKQPEEDQIWVVYNSETNRWLRRVLNDAYWQPENAERSGFGSKEIAEGNIKWLHENGTLRAKIEHCKAVLVSPKKSEQPKEKQPQTDQPSPEKGGEKQGEADGADSPTWKVWIVKTNPNYSDKFAPFYLEYVNKYNVISHTPNAKDAMKFNTDKEANAFLNKVILDSSARYIPSNFGLRKLDEYGVVTTHY